MGNFEAEGETGSEAQNLQTESENNILQREKKEEHGTILNHTENLPIFSKKLIFLIIFNTLFSLYPFLFGEYVF